MKRLPILCAIVLYIVTLVISYKRDITLYDVASFLSIYALALIDLGRSIKHLASIVGAILACLILYIKSNLFFVFLFFLPPLCLVIKKNLKFNS